MHNLIIQTYILSRPYALLMLRALATFNLTPSLKENEQCLAIETYCSEEGTTGNKGSTF